jgi:antitoxin HicB
VRQFTYAVKLTRDRESGGFVVTCRDLPEAITQGETAEAALLEAADCLEEAIAARIDDERSIPEPSASRRGERLVSVPPSMALKAAVYLAVREAGISNSELARRMRLDEKEARRILDPHHPTKITRIEAALSVLGRHVKLSLA